MPFGQPIICPEPPLVPLDPSDSGRIVDATGDEETVREVYLPRFSKVVQGSAAPLKDIGRQQLQVEKRELSYAKTLDVCIAGRRGGLGTCEFTSAVEDTMGVRRGKRG
jgi:hypothetical protein